jgi:hypothetical protein
MSRDNTPNKMIQHITNPDDCQSCQAMLPIVDSDPPVAVGLRRSPSLVSRWWDLLKSTKKKYKKY